MTSVFLYTFFVGFGLTVISAVLGVADAAGGHAGHGGHGGGDLSYGGEIGHVGHSDVGKPHVHADPTAVSPINFQSIVAFLMGFGGVGYVLSRLPGMMALVLVLPLAAAGGLFTGWLLLKWLRFLKRGERPMGPTSYVGIVGKLTAAIRPGGTGELIYAHHGTRMVLTVRSASGESIERGEEVVVLRYEKGVAYVQPWREFMLQQKQ